MVLLIGTPPRTADRSAHVIVDRTYGHNASVVVAGPIEEQRMSQSPQHAGVATAQLDLGDSRIQFVGVPGADEVRIVSGTADDDRFVALFRRGDRLTGALTLNGQAWS